MFKRRGVYYASVGSSCCACTGGSNMYMLWATSPAGPWKLMEDVGSRLVNGRIPSTSNVHDPNRFTTRAQGTAVFKVGRQVVWLGNQWNTGPRRNADLLYWAVLEFEGNKSRNATDGTRGKRRVPRVLPLKRRAITQLMPWGPFGTAQVLSKLGPE